MFKKAYSKEESDFVRKSDFCKCVASIEEALNQIRTDLDQEILDRQIADEQEAAARIAGDNYLLQLINGISSNGGPFAISKKIIDFNFAFPENVSCICADLSIANGVDVIIPPSTSVIVFSDDQDSPGGDINTYVMPGSLLPSVQRIAISEINQLQGCGQSNAVGQTAQPLINTTQPYSNITWEAGPKMGKAGTLNTTPGGNSFKPLVEDGLGSNPPGLYWETACSAAANYATKRISDTLGIPTSSVKILSSVAGWGNTNIDQWIPGGQWYPTLEWHIDRAQAVSAGLSQQCALGAFFWIQGENNAGSDTNEYKSKLSSILAAVESRYHSQSSFSNKVHGITYQCSYSTLNKTQGSSFAQLEICKSSPYWNIATPTYILPHSPDGIHLTNVGQNLLGAYIGRCYYYLYRNMRPQWINPLSATIDQNEIIIKLHTPTKPLVFDTSKISQVTNYGFKVLANNVDVPINSVSITSNGDEVKIVLSATPTGTVVVRYGYDYQAANVNIVNGAAGNLRDSTPDVTIISGQAYDIPHWCPHFSMQVQ